VSIQSSLSGIKAKNGTLAASPEFAVIVASKRIRDRRELKLRLCCFIFFMITAAFGASEHATLGFSKPKDGIATVLLSLMIALFAFSITVAIVNYVHLVRAIRSLWATGTNVD
jgi:hypothetical protein